MAGKRLPRRGKEALEVVYGQCPQNRGHRERCDHFSLATSAAYHFAGRGVTGNRSALDGSPRLPPFEPNHSALLKSSRCITPPQLLKRFPLWAARGVSCLTPAGCGDTMIGWRVGNSLHILHSWRAIDELAILSTRPFRTDRLLICVVHRGSRAAKGHGRRRYHRISP